MQLNLKGWKAVPALIVIVGLGVFRWNSQNATLETDGVERVENWLVAEATREALPELQRANTIPSSDLGQLAEDLQENRFAVVSVKRHGRGSRIVARVEVRHEAHPGKSNVRYFKMSHSLATGWRVQRETSQWDYYLSLF